MSSAETEDGVFVERSSVLWKAPMAVASWVKCVRGENLLRHICDPHQPEYISGRSARLALEKILVHTTYCLQNSENSSRQEKICVRTWGNISHCSCFSIFRKAWKRKGKSREGDVKSNNRGTGGNQREWEWKVCESDLRWPLFLQVTLQSSCFFTPSAHWCRKKHWKGGVLADPPPPSSFFHQSCEIQHILGSFTLNLL